MQKRMNGRQKRLIEVYDYMREHYSVHTKSDFARVLNYGRTSMAAAMGGKEAYLTDNLFKKICDVCPVFNINYLLAGEGELLLPKVDKPGDAHIEALRARIKDLEELVATQRALLRSLGVEYLPSSGKTLKEGEDTGIRIAAESE